MTTQYVTASYQEIIDLHTETDRVSVIGIHTPTNRQPYDMLKGFFDLYQKFHYDGCSLALVPAARLPADPSQVSYGAGQPPIDPRDMLNPILWHGCHGESLGAVLNQFYSADSGTSDISRRWSASVEENMPSTGQVGNKAIFETLYYRALVDNTWQKAHPQRGFRKSGLRPLVYSVATDRQYINSDSGTIAPRVPGVYNLAQSPSENNGNLSINTSGNMGTTISGDTLYAAAGEGLQDSTTDYAMISPSRTGNQFFTSRLTGLGWLDTRSRLFPGNTINSGTLSGDEYNDGAELGAMYNTLEQKQFPNYLPRLFMGICLLPPAYKTEQYFRLVLNHRFSFKKFRGVSMRADNSGNMENTHVPEYSNFNNSN